MDFLEIRKRAKERAQAREAEKARASSRAPAPGADPGAPSSPALTQLAETPRGVGAPPPADEIVENGSPAGAHAEKTPEPSAPLLAGGSFKTWRPGTGAAPIIGPDPVGPPADLLQGLEESTAASFEVPAGQVRSGAPAAAPAAADPLDEFFYREDETGPALGELSAGGRAAEPPGRELAREEFLTFLLGDEEFAVAIERVREVVRPPPLTEVPRAPHHVLGVVTVRGEVVAVVDPRRRLGLAIPGGEGPGKIVIVDAGEGPCGLWVDRVANVVRLRPGSIEPCPQGIAGQRAELIAGIGRDGERLFTVLDVAMLLRTPARAEGPPRRVDAGA